MMSYNKKCKGCGGILTDDANASSYVPKFDPDKTIYCYRCFRLKHYNETSYTEQAKIDVKNVIDKLDFNQALVFLIVDVLDLEHTLFKLPDSAQKICIVVNKMDLLPIDLNYDKLCENIRANIAAKNIGETSIIFTSINSKSSLIRLEEQLYATKKLKHYFVGKSNVGKSSLINALLKRNDIEPTLTASSTINTTINLQKIIFPRFQIIDTPGFLTEENILNFIAREDEKKLFNQFAVKPLIFQLKGSRTLCIENLIQINLVPQENKTASAVCFMNSQLNITTCKFTDEDKLTYPDRISYNIKDYYWACQKHEFDKEKMNLCISGLGLIAFKNVKNCEIRFLSGIGVNLMKIHIV